MITLHSLSLTDFMCIESVELDFSDNFITIITGNNGSGKSSILEAIALCFTERRRGDSFKDYIRHGSASSKIHLEATIQSKAIIFDVSIVDKKGSTPFQRSIQYDGVTYINSECSVLLQSFDVEYLQHIMFSMQGEGNITDLKPAERARLLKRILNFEFTPQIESLDQMINQAMQESLILQTKADSLSKRTFQYERLRPALDDATRHRLTQDITRDSITLKNLEREVLLQTEIQQRLSILRAQHTELSGRKSNIEFDIRTIEAASKKSEADKQKYTTALNELPNVVNVQGTIAELVENIEIASQLIEQEDHFIVNVLPKIEKLQSKNMELSTHIEAHKQGKCPQCGQNTHPEKVPTMVDMLNELTKDLGELADLKDNAVSSIAHHKSNILAWKTEIGSLTNAVNNSQLMRKQYTELLKTIQDNLDHSTINLQQKRDSLATVITTLSTTKGQIDEMTANAIDTSSIYALDEKIKVNQKQLQDDDIVKNVNATIVSQNERIKKEATENEQALQENNQQLNTLLTNIATYREAKKILETDLPNYIIVKACSKLEKHLNTFIANVRKDMVVRLLQSRSGVEFFYSPNGMPATIDDWTSTKMASGFEKELLATAWRVALARAYNLSILLLDEIDSAANPVSSEKMFRELANLQGFEQLIIITHKPEVVDILQQENVKAIAYNVVNGNFFKQEY